MRLISRFFYVFYLFNLFVCFSLFSQNSWGNKPVDIADYLYISESYQSSFRYYGISSFFPNLKSLNYSNKYNQISSSLRLNDPGSEKKLMDFVDKYPTKNIENYFYFDLANFFFYKGDYPYALKWFKKLKTSDIDFFRKDEYFFNKGYTLFATKQYKSSKQFFEKVKDVPKYQYDSNYYLGYISYQLDDYNSANQSFSNLNELESKYKIGYLQADMNFKLGRFDEAIKIGEANLKNVPKKELSDLSKIIGESYFNLKEYPKALIYLNEYKGKNGKWSHTDFYQLGYTYYKLNKYQEAINQFNKIISGKNELAQSAYYFLGDCYIKMNLKSSALNAFKIAMSLKYNPTIEEDANLNYVKLSYDIGNPYEDLSIILRKFIEDYPKNSSIDEVKKLLIHSYVLNNNHDAALKILDKENKNIYKEPLQKVNYMKAVDLYRLGSYNESINYFNKSLEFKFNPIISATCLYWKAQALFELNDYDSSIKFFNEFKSHPESKKIENIQFIDYNLAYCYLKKKDYDLAINFFNSFLKKTNSNKNFHYDAILRLADSYFALKAYWPAMDNYFKIFSNSHEDSDYALYQTAKSYGFIDRTEKKIKSLENLVNNFEESNLMDDSLFELALSYSKENNNKKALESYDQIIKYYDSSPYRSKALLNKALILYNDELLLESYEILKRLVRAYPNESLSRQALIKAKEIAIDLVKVQEFEKWVLDNKVNYVSKDELEQALFSSGEKLFDQNKDKAALKIFNSYLEKYPISSNSLNVNFLIAEIYFKDSKWEKCLKFYKNVIGFSANEFTEKSLIRISKALINLNRRYEAVSYLNELESIAQFDENKNYALLNLMKIYFDKNEFKLAKKYSKKVINNDFLVERVKWDALYILAKSFEGLSDFNNASDIFKKIEKSPNREYSLEAIFFDANQKHFNRQFEESNLVIQNISKNYSGYPIWSAKSLLLMSKNFYSLNDSFQAIFILETIISNFSQFPNIVSQAKEELEKIKSVEINYNSSIDNKKYEDEI